MTKRILSMLLVAVLVVGAFAACTTDSADTSSPASTDASVSDGAAGTEGTTSEGDNSTPVVPDIPVEDQKPATYQEIDLADVVEHEDYSSVYEMIGSKITIDMVEEDYDTGLAYVEYEGVKYELGMDFLSMAMVYNTTPAGDFATAEDAYNEWWRLYIQRWNYLVAEVPLYSNMYFDVYNAKIGNFETTPFWSVDNAIISATLSEGTNVTLGDVTELSGSFRNSSWGKSSPGASDLAVENLTSGHATIEIDKTGTYNWNMNALASEPVATINEDGTLTYTITIKNDLKFSDGSAITAKNYVAGLLANSTVVAQAAGGTGASGYYNVGYDEFMAYDGTNEGTDVDGVIASKYFSGIKLIDEYTFSATYAADYANYYYKMIYAGFGPTPLALYLGDNDVIVDENGSCGLSDGFYAIVEEDGADVYAMADVIVNNLKWNSDLPYSGPYVVSNYDETNLIATLTLNPNYTQDGRGKATIPQITYVKIISETQLDQFTSGQVDVLAGITGGDETEAALAAVNANPDKFKETHYDRAGYGKIGFRGDLGPTNFIEVRQAIMYTINRPDFAQTFTGGYGTVVHGPYYEGFPAFQANKDIINLNQYTYSADEAIAVLEAGGWVYDENGNKFDAGVDAVRYKKLEGYEKSAQNLQYASVDGKYKTVKIDGEYYMPLAINWYGTQPNSVTDQLIIAWQQSPIATTDIGAYITYTSCDFTSGLYGEYLQLEAFGWDGVAKLCAINFATGFNSAAYDYAMYWTIDPAIYADYSGYYIMDEADFWENYKAE